MYKRWKSQRDPLLGVLQNTNLNNHNICMCRGSAADPCRIPDYCLSLCSPSEPWLIGSVALFFACSGDPFPPTGLPCPALIWQFVSNILVTSYIVLSSYSCETCSFWREMEEEWNWGRVRDGEGTGKSGEKRNWGWDVWEGNKFERKLCTIRMPSVR